MDKVKETLTKLLGSVKTKWTDMCRKGHIIFFSVAGVVVISDREMLSAVTSNGIGIEVLDEIKNEEGM